MIDTAEALHKIAMYKDGVQDFESEWRKGTPNEPWKRILRAIRRGAASSALMLAAQSKVPPGSMTAIVRKLKAYGFLEPGIGRYELTPATHAALERLDYQAKPALAVNPEALSTALARANVLIAAAAADPTRYTFSILALCAVAKGKAVLRAGIQRKLHALLDLKRKRAFYAALNRLYEHGVLRTYKWRKRITWVRMHCGYIDAARLAWPRLPSHVKLRYRQSEWIGEILDKEATCLPQKRSSLEQSPSLAARSA